MAPNRESVKASSIINVISLALILATVPNLSSGKLEGIGPMTGTSKPNQVVTIVIEISATNVLGTALVNLGNKYIIATVELEIITASQFIRDMTSDIWVKTSITFLGEV
tara:strand:+ start:190 stop:516 length:327 start_codon:yes stop_codon:yes gene_type:complete